MKFCTQQQILNWMNVTWSKMKKLHWTDSEFDRTYLLCGRRFSKLLFSDVLHISPQSSFVLCLLPVLTLKKRNLRTNAKNEWELYLLAVLSSICPPASPLVTHHFVSLIKKRQRWDVQTMWAYDLDLWPMADAGCRPPSADQDWSSYSDGIRKIWRTMCVSINGPGDPDLRTFDLETGMQVASKVGNLPFKFGHARPLSSRIIRYVRDGWTDRQTDGLMDA